MQRFTYLLFSVVLCTLSTVLVLVVNESNNWFVLTHFHLFLIDSSYTHGKYRANTGNNVSLHTQTGLPSFTIQVQNAIVTQQSVLVSVTLYMTI